jgi:hypothetical protein
MGVRFVLLRPIANGEAFPSGVLDLKTKKAATENPADYLEMIRGLEAEKAEALALIRCFRHPPTFASPEDANDFGEQLLKDMDAMLAEAVKPLSERKDGE